MRPLSQLITDFIEECCATDPRSSTPGTRQDILFARFCEWCPPEEQVSPALWNSEMKQRFTSYHGKNMKVFYMAGLKEAL